MRNTIGLANHKLGVTARLIGVASLAMAMLAACGGGSDSDGFGSSSGEITLSNKSGSDALLESEQLNEVSSGHVPNNRAVPFGRMWFQTPFNSPDASAYLRIDFYEPPTIQNYTVVDKQWTDYQPGDAAIRYEEWDDDGRRGFYATSGTITMTEAAGGTIAIAFSNLAMEPDPFNTFGVGMGTFDFTGQLRTTNYDPN